ncbi:zinc finger protein 831 isoform X2 [Dunckerocampus dactyliophorus]|nr:zinc finger protein 831 isoform X2 [Dunckerocampus dactyliophorus]
METGKQEIEKAQKEMAAYTHSLPGVSVQAVLQSSAGEQEPAKLCLPMPPIYSKETLPFLTLHIVGGLQSQSGLNLAAAAPIARPKSSGKHVCPHCGRDCMKPSVLEKHLRCHTGERPYPCTICGVSFKTQSNLYKHKRTQVHARLSYESEQSSVGSLEGISRDMCTTDSSLDECPKESLSLEQDAKTAEETKNRKKQGNEQPQPLLNPNQHIPLQRQGATLFSKQWENSGCKAKSKSHDSIDSGFSEGSDQCPTPASLIPDHRVESLASCGTHHSEEHTNTRAPLEAGLQGLGETERQKDHKALEERISKLISDNTSVVEDKLLENVRPRKTILSKQGSIDLPMPYTFKDSFHFDMRNNKALNMGLQKNSGLYRSAPTQHSTTMEPAPLVRSNSLPFSVTLFQPEKSCPNPSVQSDYTMLAQSGSEAISPTTFGIKSSNHHSSAHHPLVRQTAIDCNPPTEACVMNSSVESASLSCDGDDSDIHGEPRKRKFQRKKSQKFAYNKWYAYRGGTFRKLYSADKVDDGGVGKSRRTPTSNQEHEFVQGLQRRLSVITKEAVMPVASFATGNTQLCSSGSSFVKNSNSDISHQTFHTLQGNSSGSAVKTTLWRNPSLLSFPLFSTGSPNMHKTDNTDRGVEGLQEKHTSHICGESDSKKQRTDDKVFWPVGMETDPHTSTKTPHLTTVAVPRQNTNLSYVNQPTNPKPAQVKRVVFPTPSVNKAPSPSSAKNSFLPKYQLKLPNTAEPESTPVPVAEPSMTGTLLPVIKTTMDTPTIATKVNQTPTVAVKAFSQGNPALLSYTHASGASGQLNLVNRLNTTVSSTPTTPCHIVPLDSGQPTGQNVFHVHTADLQICLQIISDEQLALIEPQIERQLGNTLSQRQNVDKMTSGVIQMKAHNSVSSTNEGRHLEEPSSPNGLDQSLPLPTPDLENRNPIQVGEMQTEHSDYTQATDLAESEPPEDGCLPHGHSLVNTTTEAVSSENMVSTAVLTTTVNPEGSQTLTFPSPSTEIQSSMKSGSLEESQHGHTIQGSWSTASTMEAQSEPCAQAHVEPIQSTNASISVDTCQIPKEADRQASVYTNSAESASSQTLLLLKHAQSECNRVGQYDSPSQTQEQSLDRISTQPKLTTESSNIQEENAEAVPDLPAGIQSPITGHLGGTNMEACSSQTKQLTCEQERSEGPKSTGWRTKQSPDANCQYVDRSGGETGDDDNGGRKRTEVETLPGQWSTATSNCRPTQSPDIITAREQEAESKVDCGPEEQHGGISEFSLHERAANMADNTDVHLLEFQQQATEMNNNSLSEEHSLQQTNSSQSQFVETRPFFLQSEPGTTLTHTLQDQRMITSVQKPSTDDNMAACFSHKSELESSPKSPNPSSVDKTRLSTDLSQVCPCRDVCRCNALTGDNAMKTVCQCKPLLRPSTDNKPVSPDSTCQGMDPHEDTGKGHSVFLADQTAECWIGGARPVQSCHEYTEDTSSSDDEDKLIIEL